MDACDAAGGVSDVSDGGGGVAVGRFKSDVPIARATNVDGGPMSNTVYTINDHPHPKPGGSPTCQFSPASFAKACSSDRSRVRTRSSSAMQRSFSRCVP